MGLGGMKRPEGHPIPDQKPEEPESCDCSHHGLEGAPAWAPRLQLGSEEGALRFGGGR